MINPSQKSLQLIGTEDPYLSQMSIVERSDSSLIAPALFKTANPPHEPSSSTCSTEPIMIIDNVAPPWYFPRRFLILGLLWIALVISDVQKFTLTTGVVLLNNEKWVLSSFYWGFIVAQVPGGWASLRFGGKTLVGLGLIGTCISNIIFPFVNPFKEVVILCRVCSGFFQGLIYPAMYQLLGTWVRKSEKSKVIGFILSVPSVVVITIVATSPIILEFGWKYLFWITGGLGIVWIPFWMLLVTNTPADTESCACIETHPYEQDLLTRDYNPEAPPRFSFSLLKTMIKNPHVQTLASNMFAFSWLNYMGLSWLSVYVVEKIQSAVEQKTVWLLAYAGAAITSIFSGVFADYLISQDNITITTIRRLIQTVALVLPAVGLITVGILSNNNVDPDAMVGLIILTIASASIYAGGAGSNFLDLTKTHTGLLLSICNVIGIIPGVFSNYLTEEILKVTQENWSILFFLVAGVNLIVVVLCLLGMSGQVQHFEGRFGR